MLIALCLTWISSAFAADVPVQGVLAGTAGLTGTRTVTFHLHAGPAGGSIADVWSAPMTVTFIDGSFGVILNLPDTHLAADQLYVSLDLDGVSSDLAPVGWAPRARYAVAAGEAAHAADADHADHADHADVADAVSGTLSPSNMPANLAWTNQGATFSGAVGATQFNGSGAGLTGVPTAALSGTVANGNLPADLYRTTGGALSGGTQWKNGAATTASVDAATGAVTAASFAGAGGGLTGLNASNLSSGTVPAARLPASVMYNTGGTMSGQVVIDNPTSSGNGFQSLTVKQAGTHSYGTALTLNTYTNGAGTQDGPRVLFSKDGAKRWAFGIEPYGVSGFALWEDAGTDTTGTGAWGTQRWAISAGGDQYVSGKYHADDVQLITRTPNAWGCGITSTASWQTLCDLSMSVTVDHRSLIQASANGHVNSDDVNPWFYSSFLLNDGEPFAGSHGRYHIYANNTNGWAPYVLNQSFVVNPGTYTVRLAAIVSGGTWAVNGAGVQLLITPL